MSIYRSFALGVAESFGLFRSPPPLLRPLLHHFSCVMVGGRKSEIGGVLEGLFSGAGGLASKEKRLSGIPASQSFFSNTHLTNLWPNQTFFGILLI